MTLRAQKTAREPRRRSAEADAPQAVVVRRRPTAEGVAGEDEQRAVRLDLDVAQPAELAAEQGARLGGAGGGGAARGGAPGARGPPPPSRPPRRAASHTEPRPTARPLGEASAVLQLASGGVKPRSRSSAGPGPSTSGQP